MNGANEFVLKVMMSVTSFHRSHVVQLENQNHWKIFLFRPNLLTIITFFLMMKKKL